MIQERSSPTQRPSLQADLIALSALPLPTILLNREAELSQANIYAQEALGTSEKRLIGLHISDLFAPKVEINKLFERLTPYGNVSDNQVCIRSSSMPISLHAGMNNEGITVIFVPEARRSEVEQHTKRHEMAEAVARIALEMAHEVKNPLAALRGATQWLSEQQLATSNKEAVAQILTGVDRIRDRIDSFLQVGPHASVQMTMTNVHSLIQGVTSHQEGFHIGRAFDPSLPETMVHAARLTQALENLWQNAVEAAESRIEWQTRMASLVHLPGHDGKVIEISITNDGAMIPLELRDRLFEPYVTGKQRGSGLGLALVERVMLEHGGRVNVDSGKGRTTMTLQLPIKLDSDGEEKI